MDVVEAVRHVPTERRAVFVNSGSRSLSSEAFFPSKVFFMKRGGGKLIRLGERGLHSLGVVSAAQRGLSCLKGWGRSCRRVPNAVLHLKFQASLTVIHRALTLYRCALQQLLSLRLRVGHQGR